MQRIAWLLSYASERLRDNAPEGSEILVPLNQQHIADYVGLSLVHTNKSLKKLNRIGLIKLKHGQAIALDPKKLRLFSEGEMPDGQNRLKLTRHQYRQLYG